MQDLQDMKITKQSLVTAEFTFLTVASTSDVCTFLLWSCVLPTKVDWVR